LYDINNLNNSYLIRPSKYPVFQAILDDSNEYASQIVEAQNRGCCIVSASTATCGGFWLLFRQPPAQLPILHPICLNNGSKLQNQEKDHFPDRRVSPNWCPLSGIARD
jgi:hypothetical protein